MTIFTTQNSSNSFSGIIGCAIFSDNPGQPGSPNVVVADGTVNLTNENMDRRYITITFDNPAPLVADTLYWAAVAYGNSGDLLFFAYHVDYNNTFNLVVRQNNGFVPPNFASPPSSLQVTDFPLWFRIYDPSSSFLVGPPGPTGPPGGTGSSSLTHVYFGAHFDGSGQNIKAGQFYFLYPGFGGQYDTQFSPTIGVQPNYAELFVGGSGGSNPVRPPPVANIPFTTATTVVPSAIGTGGGQISWTINNLTGSINTGLGVDGGGNNVGFRVRVYSYCAADGNDGLPGGIFRDGGSTGTFGVDCGFLQLGGSPLTWTNQVGNVRNGISVAISTTSDVVVIPNSQTPRTISIAIPLEVTI